jgi:hypothetical protein
VWGAVVEESTREGELAGSNPRSREARDFRAKNAMTCDPHCLLLQGALLTTSWRVALYEHRTARPRHPDHITGDIEPSVVVFLTAIARHVVAI